MPAVNLLSTENATKLPKCSKRLHFCASLPSKAAFHRGENTADTLPVIDRFSVGFAVGPVVHSWFPRGFVPFLPEIWPLRCSRGESWKRRTLHEWNQSGNREAEVGEVAACDPGFRPQPRR